MIPLNQAYRIKETLAERDDLRVHKHIFETWRRFRTKFQKHGRSYDYAIAQHEVDFTDKVVCELGARDSYLSPYLTGVARHVCVSDTFDDGWNGLGGIEHWEKLWTDNAVCPEQLAVQQRDMQATGYPDAMFDVVLSFSAIEHIRGDGDILAATEMGRICKPGGKIVISTEMSDIYRQPGGHFYDEATLFERIIDPTGCKLCGPYDFNWETADTHKHHSRPFSLVSCVFVLEKPS